MNIHGILMLKAEGLPIGEKEAMVFYRLEEIPKEVLNSYRDEKVWAMRGFGKEDKITDNPYKLKKFVKHDFSRNEIENVFNELNMKMDKENIPKEGRTYFFAKVFHDEDVDFSGHIFKKENEILIDIFNGNKPSGRDWTPHHSFRVMLINNRPILHNIDNKKYEEYIRKICFDIKKFHSDCYLDFTLLKNGHFFYHDLSFH